jgi:hypothetical protein
MLVKKYLQDLYKGYQDMTNILDKFEETCIIGTTYPFINEEYKPRKICWYDLEDACDD